ncbi:MAG: T9SS type A sorting domain-containing protein [Bacteroidales bacterium]|nr:T9SS type A sorting domain-containing protein [Bacteroidales bacterium]
MKFFSSIGIRILLMTLLCLPYQCLFSQSIQNEVVAAAGDDYVLGNNKISWTLGESIIESFQTGNILISQGFHQPSFLFSEIPEQENPGFSANIFPNPAVRYITVNIPAPDDKALFRLTICDVTGKLLLNQAIVSDQENKIDLGQFSEGILFLTIIRIKDGNSQSFKIIRTD